MEFTDGTVHDEPDVATTPRGAKRAAIAVIDARWEESRWPKPCFLDRPDRATRPNPKPMQSMTPHEPDWPHRLAHVTHPFT